MHGVNAKVVTFKSGYVKAGSLQFTDQTAALQNKVVFSTEGLAGGGMDVQTDLTTNEDQRGNVEFNTHTKNITYTGNIGADDKKFNAMKVVGKDGGGGNHEVIIKGNVYTHSDITLLKGQGNGGTMATLVFSSEGAGNTLTIKGNVTATTDANTNELKFDNHSQDIAYTGNIGVGNILKLVDIKGANAANTNFKTTISGDIRATDIILTDGAGGEAHLHVKTNGADATISKVNEVARNDSGRLTLEAEEGQTLTAGKIGRDAGNRLSSLTTQGKGIVSFSNDVFVTRLELGAATNEFANDIAMPIQFADAVGVVTIANGKHLTGAVTYTGGEADGGTINLKGGNIVGAVGTANKKLRQLNIAENGGSDVQGVAHIKTVKVMGANQAKFSGVATIDEVDGNGVAGGPLRFKGANSSVGKFANAATLDVEANVGIAVSLKGSENVNARGEIQDVTLGGAGTTVTFLNLKARAVTAGVANEGTLILNNSEVTNAIGAVGNELSHVTIQGNSITHGAVYVKANTIEVTNNANWRVKKATFTGRPNVTYANNTTVTFDDGMDAFDTFKTTEANKPKEIVSSGDFAFNLNNGQVVHVGECIRPVSSDIATITFAGTGKIKGDVGSETNRFRNATYENGSSHEQYGLYVKDVTINGNNVKLVSGVVDVDNSAIFGDNGSLDVESGVGKFSITAAKSTNPKKGQMIFSGGIRNLPTFGSGEVEFGTVRLKDKGKYTVAGTSHVNNFVMNDATLDLAQEEFIITNGSLEGNAVKFRTKVDEHTKKIGHINVKEKLTDNNSSTTIHLDSGNLSFADGQKFEFIHKVDENSKLEGAFQGFVVTSNYKYANLVFENGWIIAIEDKKKVKEASENLAGGSDSSENRQKNIAMLFERRGELKKDMATVFHKVTHELGAEEAQKAMGQLVERPNLAGAGGATLAVSNEAVSSALDGRMADVAPPSIEVSTVSTSVESSGDDDNKVGLWFKPFGGFGNQKLRKGTPGYNMRIGGAMLGVDTLVNDSTLIGGVATFANSDVKHKDIKDGDKTKVGSRLFSIYGMHDCGNGYFARGMATYGNSEIVNKELRSASGKTEIAKGEYASRMSSVEIRGGYRHIFAEHYTIAPTLGLNYTNVSDDGYTEKDTTIENLAISKKSSAKTSLVAGISISMDYNYFVPEVHVNIAQRVAGKQSKIESRLDGMPDNMSFVTKATKPTATQCNLGGGISYKTGNVILGVGLDGHFGHKYTGAQGSLNVRVNL